MSKDPLELIKTFSLIVPMNRPIHIVDNEHFTGTDLACLAKLVTAANRGGLQGHKLKSLVVRRAKPVNGDQLEVQFELEW